MIIIEYTFPFLSFIYFLSSSLFCAHSVLFFFSYRSFHQSLSLSAYLPFPKSLILLPSLLSTFSDSPLSFYSSSSSSSSFYLILFFLLIFISSYSISFPPTSYSLTFLFFLIISFLFLYLSFCSSSFSVSFIPLYSL